MKKPFKHNDLSERKCACCCGKYIKKNVIARNQDAAYRYGHDPKHKVIIPKNRNKKAEVTL
jgi:hypothetical protein